MSLTRTLSRGDSGSDVVELQLRLAGFAGKFWDGELGPGTELQIMRFQTDVMGKAVPSGRVDEETIAALEKFAGDHPIDFDRLSCPCGQCGGFGQGRFRGEYMAGQPKIEAYHRYEYPGIHKAILHTLRAAVFYATRAGLGDLIISSGYRCHVQNQRKGRTSTNHMGKAIDVDLPMKPGDDRRDDMRRADALRAILVEKSDFQTGWDAKNWKALEPSHIAPTWVHMDVRQFEARYLTDEFFVKSAADLA